MTAELRTVEARLLAAAEAAAWPATPDLRDPVLARVAAVTPDLRGPVLERITGTRPAPPARRLRRPFLRGLALALIALAAAAGAAVGLGYRLPGLDIVFAPTAPTTSTTSTTPTTSGVSTPPPAGTALDLGSPIPLAEALAGERPRVLVPAALPAPSTAWTAGAGERAIVTLAWRADAGQPVLEDSDLSLVLMAVPGTAEEAFLMKTLGPDTTISPVSVGGDRGWWISGDVHELRFLRPDGEAGVLPTRLVGDTLVFSRDGTLYRLESTLGREATLAIAESLPH